MTITKPISYCYKEPVFIADNNIGDIVKYLRMLGFDVVFDPAFSRQEIISVSVSQNRILLTRCKDLFNYEKIFNKVLIGSETTAKEVVNIIRNLGIKDKIKAFSRCLLCNTELFNISKKEIESKIPPKVKAFCDEYTYCRKCDKIYWEGTHFIRMKKIIDDMLEITANR